MDAELIFSEVDVSLRGVDSSRYTYSRTPGMVLCSVHVRYTEDGETWENDSVEFWAPGLSVAKEYLEGILATAASCGFDEYSDAKGLEDEATQELVRAFAPEILELDRYSSVAEVIEAGQHVEYVTKKLIELLGSVEDEGVSELLGGDA